MSQLVRPIVNVIAIPALCLWGVIAANAEAPIEQDSDTLFETVSKLDHKMFDSFNHCSSTQRLQEHASYFAVDVEFYHDTGGVTWNRAEMLANTEKNACGNYRRELVSGSLKVFPIKDFGAIAQGAHRFCQISTGDCEGLADFTIVWRKQDRAWQATRALSYGHRPNE